MQNNHFHCINFPVPVAVKEINDTTATKNDNVAVYCDASGIPPPTVTWTQLGVGEATVGNWFTITNITKVQAGQYRCNANNTCGNAFTETSIDVQCKNTFYLKTLYKVQSKFP